MEGLKELLTGLILLLGVLASILNSKSAKELFTARGFVYGSQQIMLGAIGVMCLAGCVYQFYKFFVSS
jgi:hypothetical protein